MATALVILAVGAVLAGYIGVPHFLGGSNRIETFLEPSFHPASATATGAGPASHAAEPSHATGHEVASHAPAGAHDESHDDPAKVRLEWSLMAVSVALAFAGIGLATLFFKLQPQRAERMAASLPGVHRLLLNKYYVDEAYDAVIVQPIKATSERFLWKTVDAGVIDGLVNGTGAVVRGGASVLRLFQTGSVRAYAASVFIGVLFVVAYYLVR
jgi:NADH-quinone oxidoreductase subunit L